MSKSTQKQLATNRVCVHESAHMHVSGEAVYVDDIPELAGTLHCALGLSAEAHANINAIDLEAVRAVPGVIAVFTAADIPGVNDCGPINHDDPILADSLVQYTGQPLFAVVATSHDIARFAATQATVDYSPLPAALDPLEACKAGSLVVPPMQLQQGDAEKQLHSARHRMQGQFSVGGQEQFYLEGQISYVIPVEDQRFHAYCSTQHPSEMQQLISHALDIDANRVTVEIRRMGGGFGGKESQSALFVCVAAVCANALKRPVKLRLDRDDDFLITGKRHDFYYDYDVGFDENGVIQAARIEMVSRAGFSTDLSPPVAARAACHFDNAYYLSDVDIKVLCAKTNTQSNTAFRGFGGPQGAIAIEYIIDDIARTLGCDALEVRKANFYGIDERNVTPYDQPVEDNVIVELVEQLQASSEYQQRLNKIREYNQNSEILKKGIALTPLKFGISFNMVHFNQAGALVHVYLDGTVLVNHGGTEMGQGLNTKVAQVVAKELGVNIKFVSATATRTDKVANTSATAASTGADLNGKAAQNAAQKIKQRLTEFAAAHYRVNAQDIVFENGQVIFGATTIAFAELILKAYAARIQLWSDGFYATPKLQWDSAVLKGRPFFYFAYGASVSEVQIDTLTGEWKLLRADLLHDAGNSINPAIDIGQVEGAFIQGMGWLTTEELWWNDKGRLMTHAPSTYKIPAINDCPDDFRVALFKNRNHEDSIMRSKAVGEPPLLLSFSVFFAIRDAIASVAGYKVNPPLNAPASCEEILNAVNATRSGA
ncbi:MAG: xanthine dehydrogenase molybdopterin binding subunit [Proteobacteria bacterium]|nr:xanthine dehydrogenase molybdopterin binding subunit [Pseudomonadota bacterium]